MPNFIETINMDLPTRLSNAFQSKQLLADQQIFFAPIRHHSPACAYALQHYIQQLKPTHIFIEAPESFQFLLESLLDAETQPPVAVFAQAQSSQTRTSKPNHPQENSPSELINPENELPELNSAYFPFCEYSPEWIALKQGRQIQAQLNFIDLSWAKQSTFKAEQEVLDWQQKNLISERYLAHSQFIQKLATQLHCRNHDELWDHLFELQSQEKLKDSEYFFNEVFTWCSFARLDYEKDVLLQEASLHREDCMWQHIQQARQAEHRILVVTGGFHTLALIESLAQPQQTERFIIENKKQAWQEQAWLIRYSFDRLDALNGYASGMPSPAYYQHVWLDLNTEEQHSPAQIQQQFFQYLNQLCHYLDHEQTLDVTPYIALKNTAELAWKLAELRGHYRPSRYDLLDALQSALVKGEIGDGQHHLFAKVYQFLSGQQLGKVAKNQHSPALLQNTYQQIAKYRFNLNDTISRTRKLDIYRKNLHQDISQFLHLLEFVDCGFAHRLSGPDFVHGAGLDLLFEEWRYAWSPSVEARLIELAELGDQLQYIALGKIIALQKNNEQNGLGQSAFETAKLLALACRLGLKQQLQYLSQQLDHFLESDQNLTSLIGAAQQLYYLWHGRKLLQLPEQQLQQSLQQALFQACFLLDQLNDTHEEKIEQNLKDLKTLHELILNLKQQVFLDHQAPHLSDDYHVNTVNLLDLMYQHIDVQKLDEFHLSKLKGAVDVLMFLDDRLQQDQLKEKLKLAFAVGSDAEEATQYLHGMFYIAPEIFVQSEIAIHALHELVTHWSEETFIRILPDLRYIFSQLSPKQSTTVSKTIAIMTGLGNEVILDQVMSHISANDVMEGVKLNLQLQQMLQNDHLENWIKASPIQSNIQSQIKNIED